MINEAMESIINKIDLSKTQMSELFDEILAGLVDENLISSFLTALKCKGLSQDEILGAIISVNDSFSRQTFNLIQNDAICNNPINRPCECLDVSIIQDLICSAYGLFSYRMFDLISQKTNSLSILKFMGLKIGEKEINFEHLDGINIYYENLSSEERIYKYCNRIKRNLPFDNLLDVIYDFINPIKFKNVFFGINNKNNVNKTADLFLKLGYENSIILSSQKGIPFVTMDEEVHVAEAWKNKIFTYVLSSELLGFQKTSFDDIKCENDEENASIILDIISNKIKDGRYDMAIINSALSLYIAKKASSIMDGVELARKAIESGLTLEKFKQTKAFYS